jgi:hypothetical protein
MNKLYLISQDKVNGYDSYDSAVVCAESPEAAREIHPNGYSNNDWKTSLHTDVWVTYEDRHIIKVKYLGESNESIGLILASFNAG